MSEQTLESRHTLDVFRMPHPIHAVRAAWADSGVFFYLDDREGHQIFPGREMAERIVIALSLVSLDAVTRIIKTLPDLRQKS